MSELGFVDYVFPVIVVTVVLAVMFLGGVVAGQARERKRWEARSRKERKER